jgi:class 3 adenylate cyclase
MALEGGPQPGIAAVVFTDLVGSTEVRTRLGDRAADDIRREHDRALAEAVGDYSGRIVKGVGDGIMAVFSSAADALESAVAMQRAVDGLNRRGRLPTQLGLRVGVSAGDVSWEDGDCFGTPVIEAGRLCATADGGEIRCAEAVRWLARGRGGLTFAELGPLDLKGLGEPVNALALDWTPEVGAELPLPPWTASASEVGYVGRSIEFDRAIDIWKRTETGVRTFAVIAGEPGIGKTRFAVEVAKRVIELGGVVVAGRCDEDVAAPYQPFAEVLRHVVEHGGDLRGRLGRFAGELVRLVPELTEKIPNLPAPVGTDPDTERWRLFDAVASWFGALTAERPVMLILDDLHWASRPTLQLLGHLLKSSEGSRLLILATYRDTELRRTHPLSEALVDLRQRVGIERVVLHGLTEDEIVTLFQTTAGHDIGGVGRQLAKAVWTETEGNPFFVGEVMRNLMESGRLYEEDGRWVVDGPVSKIGIPEGVREVIGRRLSRLTAATNEALTVAAVVGTVFDRAIVEASGGGDGEALDEALDEAVDTGLLEEMTGKPGHYRFAHTLVRSTLYEELRTARRVRLHARIAEAIETVHAKRLDQHFADLAHHYSAASAAGFGGRAVAYAVLAAERAASLGAYDEAATFCELGMDAAELSGDDEAACDLMLTAGMAEWRAGDPVRARATFERAATLARELGDPDRLARAAYGSGGGEVRPFWVEVGRVDPTLIGLLEEALAELPSDDSALRSSVIAMLGRELVYVPDALERRRALADEAVAMARRLGDPRFVGRALSMWMLTTAPCGSTRAERDAATREIIAIGRELGDAELEFSGTWSDALVAMEGSDRDRFLVDALRGEELAEILRQPFYRWMAAALRASFTLISGDLEAAEEQGREALLVGQTADEPTAYEVFGAQLITKATWRDEYGRYTSVTSVVTRQYPTYSMAALMPTFNAMAEGRPDDARRHLDDLVGVDFSPDGAYLATLANLSWLVAEYNHPAGARWAIELWTPHIGGQPFLVGPIANFPGSVNYYMGLMHIVLDDPGTAIGWLELGCADAERLGAPHASANAKAELARALLMRGGEGDAERAEDLLADALATAEARGYDWIVRRVAEVRADLAIGPSFVTKDQSAQARPTLRERAERVVTSALSGMVGNWVRDRSDADIERRFGSARVQRAVFNAMARAIGPENAGDLHGDLVFELTRVAGTAAFPEPDVWTIELRSGEATARQGHSTDALLVARLGIPDFVRLLGGEIGGWDALVQRRMRMEGDMSVALRLEGLFAASGPLEGVELPD